MKKGGMLVPSAKMVIKHVRKLVVDIVELVEEVLHC